MIENSLPVVLFSLVLLRLALFAVGELVDSDLALHDLVHDLLLEVSHLLRRHRVRLSDHRDYVDLAGKVNIQELNQVKTKQISMLNIMPTEENVV